MRTKRLSAACKRGQENTRSGAVRAVRAVRIPAPCPQAAEAILTRLLDGAYPAALQSEWLRLLQRHGGHLPARLLSHLLEAATRQPALRALLLPVLDKRGHWLARLHADWTWAANRAADDDAAWDTGTPEQRLLALRSWRARDPQAARDALAAAWPGEAPEQRAALLPALTVNLGLADETFLATALDDRRRCGPKLRSIRRGRGACCPSCKPCWIHGRTSMAHEERNAEAAQCWRLVLGQDAVSNAGLTVEDAAIDSALDTLYGTPESAKGGLGASAPRVARWLGDIRESFPSSVVQTMQKDALERLGLQQMRCEAEMLAAVEPEVHLVAALLSLNRVMPDKSRATARMVVGKVVEELERKLASPMRWAVQSSLNRAARNRRPRHQDIDWLRDIVLCVGQSGSMAA